MCDPSGAETSQKPFYQSALILLALMLLSGILPRVIPAGSFTRFEEAGRVLIDPGSYQPAARPDRPVWHWPTAPVEVLWGVDSALVSVISLFILMVGGRRHFPLQRGSGEKKPWQTAGRLCPEW